MTELNLPEGWQWTEEFKQEISELVSAGRLSNDVPSIHAYAMARYRQEQDTKRTIRKALEEAERIKRVDKVMGGDINLREDTDAITLLEEGLYGSVPGPKGWDDE